MTDNVLARRKVGYWVHSGGVDPATGTPSYASKLRLHELVALLARDAGEEVEQIVFFSGEPTRLSGGYQQGQVIADWADLGMSSPRFVVFNLHMLEAYAEIGLHHGDVDELKFVNDDWYMGLFAWKLADANRELYAKVQPVYVAASKDTGYEAQYPRDYVAGYNALAWLREALRVNGKWQMALFAVDRALNKPTRNPLKKAVAAFAHKRLKPSLR